MTNPIANEHAGNTDVLSLYRKILPTGFFDHLRKQAAMRANNRVYTFPVVMWLIITQRLASHGSMENAVLDLLRGLPRAFGRSRAKG